MSAVRSHRILGTLALALLVGTILAAAIGSAASTQLTAAPAHGSANKHGATPPRPRRPPAPPTGPPTARPPAAIGLSANWSYLPDPKDIGLRNGWGVGRAPKAGWKAVSIPDDFNPTVEAAGYRGAAGWYRTTFRGPTVPAGRAWRVEFEGVRRNATVWLNGYQIGQSHNPYAPFRVPAASLEPHRTNTLIVRDDDYRGAGAFPEDWWNWGGITGPVALAPTGRLEIQQLGVVPQLGCSDTCGNLRVLGTLVNSSPSALEPKLLMRVRAPGGHLTTYTHSVGRLKPGAAANLSFPIAVHSPVLWSPSHPARYRVEVQTIGGGRVEADDRLSVGMRSVKVSRGVLYLNGKRLWLHGASIQEDIAGHGAALSDADVATVVSQLKAVGANVTRAHYQLSPRLLDALDAAGIMVWAQPAVGHADARLSSAGGRTEALALLRSTLVADRNHPSVIVDSVANELSSTPDSTPGTRSYLAQAIALARRLNPGVPVGLDIYCYSNFPAQQLYRQLNVIGIDDYFGWGMGIPGHPISDFAQLSPYLQLQNGRYPNQALVLSEYGAEAFYDGPASTKGTYEFQGSYIQQTLGVLDQLPFMNGSIYWTLREFAVNPGWIGGATLPGGYSPDGIHHKGLVAYSGARKPAFAIAQQLFATPPSYVGSAPPGASRPRSARRRAAAPVNPPALRFCTSRWCSAGPGGHLPPT